MCKYMSLALALGPARAHRTTAPSEHSPNSRSYRTHTYTRTQRNHGTGAEGEAVENITQSAGVGVQLDDFMHTLPHVNITTCSLPFQVAITRGQAPSVVI